MAKRQPDGTDENDDPTGASSEKRQSTGASRSRDAPGEEEQPPDGRRAADRDADETVVSRRSALKIAGVGAAGVGSSLFGRTASAATTYHAVDDLGWDPNGDDPIQNSLASAYGDNVTIRVPPGQYRVSDTAFVRGSASNFTLEGTGDSHKDVQFVADPGFRGRFFDVRGGAGPHTLRNFSIQQHDDTETTVNVTVKVDDGLLIEDVEHLGFTPDDGDGSAGNQLSLAITSRGGSGVVRRYYNREGGQILTYPDRQAGCWVGGAHSGVLTFEDCVFIELGGSCIYASRHSGTVRIEGGYYANNDHHDMRISNERGDKVGWIRDAVFLGDYSLCQFSKADAHEGGEGTWIEHGDGRVVVENCDYWYRDPYPTKPQSGYTHFPGVVHVPDYDGDVTFRNCRLCNDVTDDSFTTGPTIAASGLSADLTVEGCSFTGVSPRSAVVADSGVVQDSAIEMSNGGDVRGGIDTSNVSSSGADPASLGAIASVYPGVDSVEGGESGNGSGGGDTSLAHTLELVGTGTTTEYEFTVSGELREKDYSLESWDDLSGSTANGYVTEPSHRDAFEFDGEVTAFEFLEGEAEVYLDGELVDPAARWGDGGSGTSWDHTLELVGTGTTTEYEFTVSGALEGADDSIESWDDISGTTATGYVTEPSHRDAFNFDGDVTAFEFLEGEAEVYLDGELVDPGTLVGDGDGSTQLPNTLTIDGTGTGQSSYAVTVDGDLQANPDAGSLEDGDAVAGSSATGTVDGDVDGYRFSGGFVGLDLEGDATVRVNGEAVDPATLGLPNRVTFDGRAYDGEASYELAVSGELANDPVLGATEDGDVVDGSSASGTVGNERDGFRFSGDLTRFRLDGTADVSFEDNDG